MRESRISALLRVIVGALVVGAAFAGAGPSEALAVVTCGDHSDNQTLPTGGNGQELEVTGPCTVGAGVYKYGNVNIFGTEGKPAFLKFADQQITFWAHSILVENFGSLLAGGPRTTGMGDKAIGTNGGLLTIYLYGKDGDTDIACKSPGGTCGVDPAIWNSNAKPTDTPVDKELPEIGVHDFFYNYNFMPFDNGKDAKSYFGSKVLAVSYGGTLQLFGKKGATYGGPLVLSSSGKSWARLKGSLVPKANSLVVDGAVDWQMGDHIVVTTTDYMPGHSEELIIAQPPTVTSGTTTIAFTNSDKSATGVKYHHNGEQYPVTDAAHSGIGRLKLRATAVETRAAVALLTRSIRILSGGDLVGEEFPAADSTAKPHYSFGAHTIVRQGFKTYQLQGVEFYQLGQGGRVGHYPIHFHMARKTPPLTYVADCSIHDSMTRWITLHATQGVTLARNVGYLSIGHGYYIEDGTETNNRLYANLGIFARAAVDNEQNPRKVPGILAAKYTDQQGNLPYHSDYDHPTVFWIMNGWNDFQYNMAAGAGTCGVCYWLVPGYNSGQENTGIPGQPNSQMTWKGYAAMQSHVGRSGTTPLMKFVGNSCTSAMNSFLTVGQIGECHGVAPLLNPNDQEHVAPIDNPLAPVPVLPPAKDVYYPRVDLGGARPATRCGTDPQKAETADCGDDAKFPKCANGQLPLSNCMVTVLDRYTSSFNWADTNISALWLRQFWYLLVDSAITDVQNGGLTFVTGGDYTRSSVIQGYWSVAKNSVFIGHTQKDVSQDPTANPYASALGPFNPKTGLTCGINDSTLKILPNHCLAKDEGFETEAISFANNQRLFNIYDGPSYQDSNAYLDIEPSLLSGLGCQPTENQSCPQALNIYGRGIGVPKDSNNICYLPNAAIAWKQPNGFFYPPAFHSTNLYFDNVPIRHFVIEPQFQPGTFKTDFALVQKRYCTYPIVQDQSKGLFEGFTDIDRQTVLNDDDGSLTGLLANPNEANERNELAQDNEKAEQETISVNYDEYFNAPIEAPECGSDITNPPPGFPSGTARTSPYDYLTTAVYPACARLNGPPPPEMACGYRNPTDPVTPEPLQNPKWNSDCTHPTCYGVPLYRQHLTSAEKKDDTQAIRMMGDNLWQRSTLTVNNGIYYIDTAAGAGKQTNSELKNIFEAGKTYYVFFVYAKPTTHQVYQMYVGKAFDPNTNVFLTRVLPNGSHFEFTDDTQNKNWPATWDRTYKGGILTVTIDMGFEQFEKEFKQAEQDFCQPGSFCKLADNQCQCDENGPYATGCVANDICSKWAGKDIDWPSGGIYGFGVKFPAGFVADDLVHRPEETTCLRQVDTGWDAPLVPVNDKDVAGACYNAPVSTKEFCP